MSVDRVLIVCGGRDYQPDARDYWWLLGVVQALRIKTIRHGACNCDPQNARFAEGVDYWAVGIAQKWGLRAQPVPADWTMGRSAGPKRNRAMLAMEPVPVAVAALQGGRGTADMVNAGRKADALVLEHPRRRP